MRSLQLLVFIAATAAAASLRSADRAQTTWYDRSPKLAIMTGFIYEPLTPYTREQWTKGLGNELDADQWVSDFKEAGASYLIFYDKWIDGLVFHDTKTTKFKTERDIVREIADACHRGNLPLVFYFNAMTDGNPEFDKWSLVDRRGKPLVFSPRWPTRVQTLHSPFRKVTIEQTRELLSNYGRIDGLWLDIFRDRGLQSTSEFVPKAFERMYGKPVGQATGQERSEFAVRTLADYLDELRTIAAKHQKDCVLTANGSAANNLQSGTWTRWVGSRLDYGSNEGHSINRMERLGRDAWTNTMPTEIGLLLNTSWFSPLEGKAPPANMTREHAIAATAMAVCQGASVYFALTPDHSGRFGSDLKLAKQVGAWFKEVEPLLKDARPYADVGVVLGTPAADGPGLLVANPFRHGSQAKQSRALDEVYAIGDALCREGVFGEALLETARGGNWSSSLAEYKAIVLPERAMLDAAGTEKLRQYVRDGGCLITFGHATLLDEFGKRREDYALADVLGAHYRGETSVRAAASKTTVKVDSVYEPQYPASHVIDGQPSFWASADAAMPHWILLTLDEPVDVARVELTSRQGPYQVQDVDVEARIDGQWNSVASVRNSRDRTIRLGLDSPVRAKEIRVTIRSETYQGQDRQLADVEAVRVFDKDGRDRSTSRTASVPAVVAPGLLPENTKSLLFPPTVAKVEPTTAKVVASLGNSNNVPAILRNGFGRGKGILVTASEASLRGNRDFWAMLARLAVGNSTISYDPAVGDRYRIVLTRASGTHTLHLIDRHAGRKDYRPAEVTLSVCIARLGRFQKVIAAGENRALETKREDGYVIFTVRPNPVASVAFK